MDNNQSHVQAIEHAADMRFHQSFSLAPNPDAGRPCPIRITYSDVDYRDLDDSSEGPVLLFIGGLFGGRYMALGSRDAMAKQHKIRLICVDKYGMGGTESVPLEHRMQAWLDTIPALLRHLNIKHIALASHCAGTPYLLNTILCLRHFLHPARPYIAILAPWVHPSYSGQLTFALANLLPVNLISNFHSAAKIISNNIMPASVFSSGLFGSSRLNSKVPTIDGDPTVMQDTPSIVLEEELDKLALKYIFLENTKGASEEALLCLKRGPKGLWGAFEDYDEAVTMLVKQEGQLNAREPEETARKQVPLKVQVFYADSDMMIGKKGAQYFDNCWRQGNLNGLIDYVSEVIPATTHDSLCATECGVIERVCAEVAQPYVGLQSTTTRIECLHR